jgi:hypothetical protein
MDHYDEVPRHNSNRWQRPVDILLTGPRAIMRRC